MKLIFKIQPLFYIHTYDNSTVKFNMPWDLYYTFTYEYLKSLKKVG